MGGVQVYSMDKLKKTIEYIEYNPVHRNLVGSPVDWRWSSAGARARLKDVAVAIDSIEFEDNVWGDILIDLDHGQGHLPLKFNLDKFQPSPIFQ